MKASPFSYKMDSIDLVYDVNSIHLTFKLESGSLKKLHLRQTDRQEFKVDDHFRR